jgi:hypothetical protein
VSDFDKMDAEAGVAEVIPNTSTPPDAIVGVGGTAEYRDNLVKKYHKGSDSLTARLQAEGLSDNESLLLALIQEMVKETDNLLGNELIAIENGSVRDSSVISAKRAEILEKAIKAVQSKQAFEKESGIDIDSPSMVVIFKYFMGKVKDVFENMGTSPEQRDIFFRTLGDETENWKKELREEFETMKSR